MNLNCVCVVRYCFDCDQNFCDKCSQMHGRIRPLTSHKMLDRGHQTVTEELLLNYPLDRCEKHVDRSVELYCNTCRKALCVACSVDATHRTHDRDEVRLPMTCTGPTPCWAADRGVYPPRSYGASSPYPPVPYTLPFSFSLPSPSLAPSSSLPAWA